MVVQRGGAAVRRGLVRFGARGARKHGLDAVRSEPTCAGAFARFDRFRKHPAFAVDVDPYLERIRRTIA